MNPSAAACATSYTRENGFNKMIVGNQPERKETQLRTEEQNYGYDPVLHQLDLGTWLVANR